ncbi:ISL3 family transposase [Streptomyces sp. WI04-05A]|uniref:ISL3 family transposase n=1 Tax=Streptomyces echiniscabiei TaxID=3028708 RepID=UPI0029A9456E|nr:ISL3 family transposase [Streptomyces sp. WI04-05B]MDX2586436.1 ISL3 family transposase [Streptomyces sp. WI04-05A]
MVRIGKSVRIRARCIAPAARCSGCGTVSARVHSRYGRRLADGAAGGQETAIDLEVRRFFCDYAVCEKRTFAEQVERLTFRYGRRTIGLQRLLEQVALALGGRAAERLAAHLAIPVSGSTLLRLIHRLELPPIPEVEVLGVDEFAFRRGRRFGAILLDMASRRPVDVLPDHTADTFAAWLRDHRHVKMVCRDRGGAFADGANRALPGIPQVADRWHLLHNLATAVEKTVRRHRTCLNQPDPDSTAVPPEETRAQQQVRARWNEIRTHYENGMRISAISDRTGLDRKTVRRYVHADTAEELIPVRPGRRSTLSPHKPYLAERWAKGCDNAQTLRDAIAARGYNGSRKSVRRFLNSLAQQHVPRSAPRPPHAVADVVRWIVGRPENQNKQARQDLKDICDRCPDIAATCRLARGFATILRRREGHRLGDWLAEVDDCEIKELRTFALGLRKDLTAVTAGLTLAWSSGAVEGNVTRIKFLKRQHYGRAGFALLRRRILLTH